MTLYPSGTQYDISCEDAQATVTEVGATLREFSYRGVPQLEGFPVDKMADGAHGAFLAPWPNRIRNGHYEFGGSHYQLALTEPERGNAIHGLVRWIPWQLSSRTTSSVSLETTIFPQTGYPFILHLNVTYAVSNHGLRVRTYATNEGDLACPYALGHHPYFVADPVDDYILTVPANNYLSVDPESLVPNGHHPVAGTQYDFRTGASLSNKVLDTCLTGLAQNPEVTLMGPNGRKSVLHLDANYRYLQLFTGDTLTQERRRRAIAIEPMTAPPNAFASDPDGVTLAPHESRTSEWRVNCP